MATSIARHGVYKPERLFKLSATANQSI